MLFFISFLYGTGLFYLFHYFPFSSCVLFIAGSLFLAFRKKFFLIAVIAAGVLYSFFRFSSPVDTLDVWNRELRVTGRFSQKGAIPADRADISKFTVDTAVDEESGGEIEDLHDKEVNVSGEFDAAADEKDR